MRLPKFQRIEWLLASVLLSLHCLITNTLAQNSNFTSAEPPDRPAAEIWSGIEDAQKNVPTEASSKSYTGRLISLLSTTPPPEEGYFVSLNFKVSKASDYELWIACSRINSTFASPCQYFLDGVEVSPEMPIQHGTKSWGVANAVSWNRFGTMPLKTGEHEFKIVIHEPRKLDGKYSIIMDAIALSNKGVDSTAK